MNAWVAVLVAGAGSFLMRALPLLAGDRLHLAERWQATLRHVGMGGIAALLTLFVLGFGRDGGVAGLLPALVAMAVGGALALLRRSMTVVLIGGGAGYAALVWLVAALS